MMKHMIYVASVALMASGMVLAQSSGSQGTMDSQIGSSTASAPQTQASPKSDMPGAMGAPTTPNESTTPAGETPATGAPTQKQGASHDNGIHSGMNSAAAPTADNKADVTANRSDPNSANTPNYAKPITSSDNSNSSSTPSQKSTDSGTTSPR
jgi:hypothetical protein